MKKLTRKEEEAMKLLWKARKGFIKELIDYTLTLTIIYNLFHRWSEVWKKKVHWHKAYGKNHEYYPLVKKEEYRKMFMKEVVSDYFGSSYKNVVSFFLDEKKISTNDLKNLFEIIEKGGKNG